MNGDRVSSGCVLLLPGSAACLPGDEAMTGALDRLFG